MYKLNIKRGSILICCSLTNSSSTVQVNPDNEAANKDAELQSLKEEVARLQQSNEELTATECNGDSP
jgi:uncharacterized protein YlxW (UPF0749 family)